MAGFGLALLASASPAQDASTPLDAKPFSLCDNPADCTRLGSIRVLGVLELPSRRVNGVRLAGLSGLAWDDDDGVLYAVSDMGALFGLRPVFRNDELTDATLVSAAPLIDPKTNKPVRFRRSDSEGLDILNGRNGVHGDAELVISFEGEPRIARYRPDGHFIADVPLAAPLNDRRHYHYNRMLESVCLHPREGYLTAPEEPLSYGDGVARLYRARDARSWRLPPIRGGISALECLPNGDLLMLERQFTMALVRWQIRLRRLHLPANAPPDTELAAETVADLDSASGLRLDNFEGLARHRGNRFFLVSDNNDSLLERTLLLYFEIVTH